MLHQKISDNLKEAMKAGQEFEVGVFRMLLSALHNKEIEKKGKGLEPALSDEDAIEVLSKEAKKRKEAIEAYTKGNRDDLVQKETEELEIIKKYLPEQLNREEVERIVTAVIEKLGAKPRNVHRDALRGKEIKDFGRVMAEAMKELKGKADASLVSELVKNNLAQ